MGPLTNKRTLNLNSRIFWRIAAVMFVSILLIETALLIFSWFTERDRQFARVEESLAVIVSLLDHQDPSEQLDALLIYPDANSNLKLTSYFQTQASGLEFSSGNAPEIRQLASPENPRHFVGDTGILTSYLQSPDGEKQYWIQTDASWINDYMRDYVLRILVMVMLISVFVTVACLVSLSPLLINPLHRLDQLLVRSEKMGIQSANSLNSDLSRKDELGGVFRSFELLRNRLLTSETENSRITKRFESFANMGADCFWEIDTNLKVTYLAGDVMRVLKLPAKEIYNRHFNEVLTEVDNPKNHPTQLVQALINRGSWEGPIQWNGSDSSPLSVRIICEALTGEAGNIIGYRGTITDISKETALAAKLKHQANHDVLTGLPNRRELTNRLEQAIAGYGEGNSDSDFSLLILDLDHFKTINDSCGHTAGDMLIKNVAEQMVKAVGEDDTVARIGGDEFALLLRSSNLEKTQQTAERIRKVVENFQFYWNDRPHRISTSIGVAQAASDLNTEEALIFAADSCCLKAKQHGKNQVQVFSVTDASVSLYRDEALWISRILVALEKNDFALFRQSIVPISSKQKEDHFEILIRMKDSDGGFWPPNLFLGAAERNNLMPKIDQWVVDNALNWLAQQNIPDDIYFCMNINLSGASLSDGKFREYLFDRVKQNQSLNQYVCFEITETAAMVSFDETIALLDELKTQGCQVALDDFGTGFSSLSHIKNLPLDYIKIDGAFIGNITDNEVDQTVVRSVAELASVLGIKTVAEFVDSDEKLKALESMKIDYAQGFLFAKPEELSKDDQEPDQVHAA